MCISTQRSGEDQYVTKKKTELRGQEMRISGTFYIEDFLDASIEDLPGKS